ncbi:hypothetical protein KR009_001711, partial [Drosophila setifemur]
MCGIYFSTSRDDGSHSTIFSNALKEIWINRGPDMQDELVLDYDAGNIFFAGCVLWQQGENAQKQPVVEGDFIILFNGDLYNIQKPDSMSDTLWLAKKVSECSNVNEILSLLKLLEGPHCLIIYNKRDQALYFSRDAFGRNSLIIERNPSGLSLLSTSRLFARDGSSSLELPPLGLYRLKVDNLKTCILHPWQPLNEYTEQLIRNLDVAMGWKTVIESIISPDWLLKSELEFDYNLYKYKFNKDQKNLYDNLISQPQIKTALSTLDKLLSASVESRVKNTPPFCSLCIRQINLKNVCRHAKCCILFSGGIDCTILALLANKHVPAEEPIELINVAFEKIGKQNQHEKLWNVPDRNTALMSLNELKKLCPDRIWNLLEVNVTRLELQQKLSTHIKHLIFPLQTVLDESLGCAFWFASHAAASTSRVALVGSGADELFGGYSRHRKSYMRFVGNENIRQLAVKNELELDWQRLPARNLARDDRVIADNGKTARTPFIEENFVRFVRSLEPNQKCCFSFPEGVGDKLLLRLYGYKLGLLDVVFLKKRAIQFGSKIANKKQHATHPSVHL